MNKLLRVLSSGALASSVIALSSLARAATGVCDVDPGDTGPSEIACINAIGSLGASTIVNDIFTDVNGKTGDQLIYGQLIDPFGGFGAPTSANGCPQANTICNGDLVSSQGTPAVICLNSSHDFNTVSGFVNTLDWKYANPIRMLNNHVNQGAPDVNCPSWGQSVTDGNKEGYKPWEGMVFDLGGPSNKVVLFPVNDHGPQPCESVEYTVYLTDNPLSREMIDDPTTTGADPTKWNRAKLSKLFLEGWKKVRPGADVTIPNPLDPNNPAANLHYTVEADSFTSVWSLPCGINFRYVGIIAGNDGKDLPPCNFDSFDAEIDAVAGLTESGAGICPDADGDKFVDCNCPTAPPICDCDDTNPAIHPGAPEPCDSIDVNCDGNPGSCQGDLVCFQSICIPTCSGGENPFCPAGSSCKPTAQGTLCVPDDCSIGGCPPGTVCTNNICVPACTDIVCPGKQICQDGQCIDPCYGIQCPSPQICDNGKCEPPCNCFAGNIGCPDPNDVCDVGNTNTCVPPSCVGVQCGPAQHCDPALGTCVDFCNPNTKCPEGQKCLAPIGCVPLCTDVVCPMDFVCNPATGQCEDPKCADITCFPPQVCVMGQCLDPGTGSGGGGAGGAGGSGGQGGMGGSGAGGASAGGAGGAPGEKGACGCRAAGEEQPGTPASALLVMMGAAALAARALRRDVARRARRGVASKG